LGEGGESAAVGEGQSGSDVDARLRSGSEPGRRRVSAVSSKSSPEAAEDSVELRSVSADMAGRALVSFLLCSGRRRRRRIRRSLPLLRSERRWSRRQAGYSGQSGAAVTGHRRSKVMMARRTISHINPDITPYSHIRPSTSKLHLTRQGGV
jgi:hypothetical protein